MSTNESIKLQWLLQGGDVCELESNNLQTYTTTSESTESIVPSEYFDTLKGVIEAKDLEALEEYLEQKEFKNEVNFQNLQGSTVIHIAARRIYPEAIECLLEAGADPNAKDLENRTPLHECVNGGCRCKLCMGRRESCIQLLIGGGAEKDPEDKNSETPIYYCAKNMYSECAKALLDLGANLSHWNDKTSIATLLVEYLPDVMKYELDKCIGYEHSDTSKLHVDFRFILQIEGQKGFRKRLAPLPPRETELLQSVLKARRGQDTLVTHPVIEAFLHFKWLAVRKFFFLLRSVYFFLVLLYTYLMFQIYSNDCISQPYKCEISPIDQIGTVILYLATAGIIISELYKLSNDNSGYFSFALGATGYLWWILCSTWIVTLAPVPFGFGPVYWQYPMAAIGVIYSWLITLLQLGRMPWFAIYVGLLVKVVQDFLRLFVTFSTILIAFTLGFCILLPDNQYFNHIPFALFKVFMMMKGDIDYDGIMDKNTNSFLLRPEYALPAHLIYTMFVLVVTMILTALLIGLAVKDIEEAERKAKVNRSLRLIKEIGIFETLLRNRFFTYWVAKHLCKWFSIEKFKEINQYSLSFSPVHPDDMTLPDSIKEIFIPYLDSCPCQERRSLLRGRSAEEFENA